MNSHDLHLMNDKYNAHHTLLQTPRNVYQFTVFQIVQMECCYNGDFVPILAKLKPPS